ncbi:histidine kinase [Brevibacterium sp. UMB10442]|nr:histidine kinase [Brevibacterium sp. UMB10442]
MRMLFVYPVIASWANIGIGVLEPGVLVLLATESLVALRYWEQIQGFVSRHPLVPSLDILLSVLVMGSSRGSSPYFLYLGATAVLIGLLYTGRNRMLLTFILLGAFILIPLILQSRNNRPDPLTSVVEVIASSLVLVVLVHLGSRLNTLQDRVNTAITLASQNAREGALGEERSRIARELHDSTVKSLVGISLLSASIRNKPESALRTAQLIEQAATTAIDESRSILRSLRQGNTGDFETVLEKSMNELEVVHNVPVTLTFEGDGVSPEHHFNLRKILEEAVTNAAVHSGTDRIDVAVHTAKEDVIARVTDYGRGFRHRSGASGHIGLASMRERAEEMGGTLTISSIMNRGTTVTVHVPGEVRGAYE